MDFYKKEVISLHDFQDALAKTPNLLDVYEFLNNGINESFESQFSKSNERKFDKISHIVDILIMDIHKNSMRLLNITKESTISNKNNSFQSFQMRNNDTKSINLICEKNFYNSNSLNKPNGFNPSTCEKIEAIQFDEEEDSFGKTNRKEFPSKILTFSNEKQGSEKEIINELFRKSSLMHCRSSENSPATKKSNFLYNSKILIQKFIKIVF